MHKLIVQLVFDGEADFSGHDITVTFTRLVRLDDASKTVEVPDSANATADAAGAAVLELPNLEEIADETELRLTVSAPHGAVLHRETLALETLSSGDVIRVTVEPTDYLAIQPNTDPSFGQPTKLRGRVIDISTGSPVKYAPLTVWARPSSGGTEELAIVATAQTDASGYFSTKYPGGTFTEAQSVVGPASNPAQVLRLNPDGSFPERLVVGVEGYHPADSGPVTAGTVPRAPDNDDLVTSSGTYSDDLGGGRCVDMTKPNRVLEEFDSYRVVRTTEPRIRGLTLTIAPKISVGEVLQLIDPKILQASVRSAGLQSTMALAGDFGLEEGSLDLGARQRIAEAPQVAAATRALQLNVPELQHMSESLSLAALRTQRRVARTGAAGLASEADEVDDLDTVAIDAEIATTLVNDPDGFTLTKLASAELLTKKKDLGRVLAAIRKREPGRGTLTCSNSIDWDHEPTIYQACTISHGHLLHFKQTWSADGYSMGDLLYSLPLAPCQKKQIAILDWSRSEAAARTESLEARESLEAFLSRDRDISEVVNASLRESLRGGSEAETDSYSAGLGHGGGVGLDFGVLSFGAGLSGGVAFGGGSASSSAWQKSSRDTSASSLQQLRDHTAQAASAVRSQRSTVVQSVRQGETVMAQSEVIANHNHCHAITVQYFEVLRHFLISQRLAGVQECLFVPLLMTRFDAAKALRWAHILRRYLRTRSLASAFDALRRIHDNYVGSDVPTGSYAEGELESLEGHLKLKLQIRRPPDDKDGAFLEADWPPIAFLVGITPEDWWKNHLEAQKERDRIFREMLGQKIADGVVASLYVVAIDQHDNEIELPIDATLVSEYREGTEVYVSLRQSGPLPAIRRDAIKSLRIGTSLKYNQQRVPIGSMLVPGSRVVVTSGQVSYRTRHLAHNLFQSSRILNDLAADDSVFIQTPLSRLELRRPREEDKKHSNMLLRELNDQIEYYHRVIWWRMDAQRRFMLLDGFLAPNAGGRSVASVVENRLTGIVGNCLVMPVAPGIHLDPTFKQDAENPIDLLEHYQPTMPVPDARVALPTRGVFAESVMGSCNSCEHKDESRFWRWEESPCPDEPPIISPISTESRRAEPPDLTAKDFPAPVIAMQNAPAAPAPTGLAAALNLLAQPNLFRDLSGLDQNQRNALAALQRAFGSAETYAALAAEMSGRADGAMGIVKQQQMGRDIDKVLNKVQESVDKKLISPETGEKLAKSALENFAGTTREPLVDKPVIKDVVEAAGQSNKGISIDSDGDHLQITPSGDAGDQQILEAAAITDVVNWLDILNFRVPSQVQTALENRGMEVQWIEDGWGQLNVDFYPVEVKKLPTINGNAVTAEEFLDNIRRNINDFVNSWLWGSFKPYNENVDKPVWTSSDATGAVIDITIPWDDGAVVCARHTAKYWIFSTITIPLSLDLFGPAMHPVSGNRQFGFYRKADGSHVFFTRGADRTSSVDVPEAAAFNGGDKLWRSFQEGVNDFINANGGESTIGARYSKRHNWSFVLQLGYFKPAKLSQA